MHEVIAACRACGARTLEDFLSLPAMPPADQLVPAGQLGAPQRAFPLTVAFCPACSLAQLRETVPPEVLFGGDYPYFSSFSEGWVAHCRANALELIETRGLGAGSLVVELACNDGYLLRHFRERGVGVLGIDPAAGPAAAARALGIEVLEEFFGRTLAERLAAAGRRADVLFANNVLAHVADLGGFVSGIGLLLKEDGVAVIEVPYVRDLIDRCEFDTIYHEHLCYYSVTSLARLFRARGLALNDVRRLPTHGGSLRLFVEPRAKDAPAVERLLAEEQRAGVDTLGYYRDFAARVRALQQALLDLLAKLKRAGAKIAAYGAAAKGATLLNSAGIGAETLDYVVDRNVHKQGKYLPGSRLPIAAPERLLAADPPDYVLLLAWNLKDEILRQQAEFRRRGGKFIIPIPHPEIA